MKIIINGISVTVPGGISSQQIHTIEATDQTSMSVAPLATTSGSTSLSPNTAAAAEIGE